MKWIKSPNRWSCLPTSFAMVLGISVEEMLKRIGHDGSEVLWPSLSEPKKRRSFHLQECIRVALDSGYSVTQVDKTLLSSPGGDSKINTQDNSEFFDRCLHTGSGVILGMGRAVPHAVAWDQQTIYDPSIDQFFYAPDLFTPESLLLVHKLI